MVLCDAKGKQQALAALISMTISPLARRPFLCWQATAPDGLLVLAALGASAAGDGPAPDTWMFHGWLLMERSGDIPISVGGRCDAPVSSKWTWHNSK
mmetsp:Transcript_88808/g.246714  ORF Transcript_88808/g.246714 Transcript_88808/m.246714 type:complete len:97 (-) Transcript_88808:1436-1726(-)